MTTTADTATRTITYREAIREAIRGAMLADERVFLMGEDVGHYGGCYAVTKGLLEQRNAERPIAQRLLPAALLLKATALALRQVPDLNGRWVDDSFRRSDDIHVGVAVSLREGGLVAPAIHDADRLDLDETMAALRDLVTRARSWRLRSSEMSDPTVTVTNLGERGVETAFPVIIPPQVAIVAFGRITDRPVAVDGMLAVHPVVTATLAADHRVTDGHTGGLFLAALDRLLQEPDQL